MNQNNVKIYPLLFGGDINVYSVARAFHEAYGIRSACYGKYASGPAYRSSIIDYRVCADNEDPETFFQNVCRYAEEHPDGDVMVIGCGDSYAKLAARYRDKFPENCIAPGPDFELLKQLIQKEQFYRLCEKYDIDYPATVIYHPEMGRDFDLPFEGPYICKPTSSVTYWEHPFEGNDKVFLLPDRESLLKTLDRCYAAGYPDAMIIQEYIPGDDSAMRVLTNYSDRNGKVRLMCLGHVLLEEHTPHGLGNHAVIIPDYQPALCEKFRTLLEDIGYTGFSNLDIKLDERDGKYKAFEINCRQGRSNYYVTGAGYNIARYFTEDALQDMGGEPIIANYKNLWRVVPRRVTRDYISSEYHAELDALEKDGKVTNPLIYKADNGLMRRVWTFHLLRKQPKNYARYYGRKS